MNQNSQSQKDFYQQSMQQNSLQYQSQQPFGSSQGLEALEQQGQQGSDNINKKLASHIQNRLKIKQMYKDKGIQMLDKSEQL
ncbi:hypothetical protein ABPG72_020900, partial [Tetrahymena utriculariae]